MIPHFNVSHVNFLKTKTFGLIAALLTVTIWASFLVGTRFAVNGDFTVEEILVLRLVPGAFALIPLMLKYDLLPRKQSWLRSIILMIAAIAAYLLAKEVPDKRRSLGLILILVGALVVGLWDILLGSGGETWKGHLMFLCGSGLFAIYSVIFRQSGLTPLHGLIIGLFWGTLTITPFLILTGNVTFANSGTSSIIVMIVLQSFVIGILATIFFNYAVKILGAAETGAFGALTPILALVGGIFLLDEPFEPFKLFGVTLVALGVLLASGLLDKPKL